MEYAENGTLSDLIRSYGKFSNELTVYYAAEILNTLEYLGKNEVIHRDLKVYNLFKIASQKI